MTSCEQWRTRLRGWIEEKWEPADGDNEPPEWLRGHAAECPRCAARLEAAVVLLRQQAPAPSADLPGRINARLQNEGRPRSHAWLRWAALPAAAALAVVVTLALTNRLGSRTETVLVRLVIEAPGAREVAVVGDWNGWDPQADPLRDRDGDGLWEIQLRLRRGAEHQYQFLVDRERWVPDPGSPLQVEDGFGGINSILQI